MIYKVCFFLFFLSLSLVTSHWKYSNIVKKNPQNSNENLKVKNNKLLVFVSNKNVMFWYYFCSKHHQSFDPFQQQKETSFKGLEDSAISLAEFLDHSLKNSAVGGDDRQNVKNMFDTLLQVQKYLWILCLKTKQKITFIHCLVDCTLYFQLYLAAHSIVNSLLKIMMNLRVFFNWCFNATFWGSFLWKGNRSFFVHINTSQIYWVGKWHWLKVVFWKWHSNDLI